MPAKDELLEYLRLKLRERMNNLSDTVTEGGCEDFPAYRYSVGYIDGLADAERELLDLDEMQHRGDDD